MSVREKALEAVRRHRLLTRGDRVAVGVSGGADSVALLHFLREISGEWDLRLEALHLNHMLRGEESLRDEAFVRRLCGEWEIPLTAQSLPVAEIARERGLSLETCARQVRYEFFGRHTAPGDKVATAHTASDNAETVLLNLVRGTALRGLCGIPPVRGNIVRPLLLCTRRDVEEYCADHGLSYVTDSSNGDRVHARNRLRLDVVPALEAVNPAFAQRVSGMTEDLRADAQYLDDLAAESLACARRGSHRCDRRALACLPGPLLGRALAALLREHGVEADRSRIRLLEGALADGGLLRISRAWYCRVAGDAVLFEPACAQTWSPPEPRVLPTPFCDCAVPVYTGKTLQVQVVGGAIFKETINNAEKQFKNVLDCDRIGEIVKIRCRMPGDRIRLPGRGCTKSLKKLLQEAGVPAHLRPQVLVLEGESGPLWVEGFGVAESAAVHGDTTRALLLQVVEENRCTQM